MCRDGFSPQPPNKTKGWPTSPGFSNVHIQAEVSGKLKGDVHPSSPHERISPNPNGIWYIIVEKWD